MELVAVGRVVRPHGVRGELVLQPLTAFSERLREADVVYLGEAAEPHPLAEVRLHRGRLLIRLADCGDRETADAHREQLVQIQVEATAPLRAGQYYYHQLIGLLAVTDDGENLGEVVEILETGSNDVYVVKGPQGQILLPALRSVITSVDLDAHRMTVHLIEGLRPAA